MYFDLSVAATGQHKGVMLCQGYTQNRPIVRVDRINQGELHQFIDLPGRYQLIDYKALIEQMIRARRPAVCPQSICCQLPEDR